jgi:4a-hydroxytetrahydrobiopterin dehydratase
MSVRLAPAQLSSAEITQRLATPASGLAGWTLRRADAATGKPDAIVKKFVFADFHASWGFMSRLVPFINATDHHPEWFNVYNRVEVVLTTHDAKGVSEKDLALASEMERVAVAFKK